MRLGLAARLSWVLALGSALIAGLTGLYLYRSSHDLLLQDAQQELLTSTKVVARRIALAQQDIQRDLLLLARHPASLAALQQAQPGAMDQLATLFEGLMRTQPAYFQIRLISAADHGLERVRVDRDADRLLRIGADDLQEKGYFPYVYDTLKLPAGSTYLSPIVINHEQGSHTGLGRPSAQFATPVTDNQGRALGVIVINLDLNGTFATLANDLPAPFQLYLANQDGDFLIHPDPAQAFGFDRGQRVLMQEEFPATAALVAGTSSETTLEASQGRHAGAPVVAVFLRDDNKSYGDDNALFLGLTEPLATVLARADVLGLTIIRIVAGFGIAGVLLAVLMARVITRPLNALNAAVQQFSTDREATALPVERRDELGQLARSFKGMQDQIRQQFAELERSHQALEHLSRHDALTELPNRRLFMERLEAAVERSKRSGVPLALLFIDLNKFKDINDRLGHDAGDAVLKAVAERLLANTRHIDTVARLGGDEFVVLLENVPDADTVAAIAQKLWTSMQAPVAFGTEALSVGLSIGISLFPQDGSTLDQLISSADTAMYRSKADPKQGIQFAGAPRTQD